jgi:uncharacterized protein
MLTINLAELARQGSLELAGEIPANDPLWEGSDLGLRSGVRVTARAATVASGEVWVKGRFGATVSRDCRRCLDAVEVTVDEELTLLYAWTDDTDSEEIAPEVRPLPLGCRELDLRSAIREELLIAAPSFVVCEPGCKGLCPRCGANRNLETCECTFDEPDPRWEKLRTLIPE